jgi:hypothetical protein
MKSFTNQLISFHSTALAPLHHAALHCTNYLRVRVRVILLLAVYRQLVRLGVKPLEDQDERYFQLNPCGHIPNAIFSLTKGWICLLQICSALSNVRIVHTENSSFYAVCKSSHRPLFAKKIMPILRILCYNGSLVT